MKIAFVYDAVYPWIKGGAERRIFEIGKRLAARGHEVHLFGVRWWKGESVVERQKMILHGVCGPRKLTVRGRRSIFEAIVFSLALLPRLSAERFDVIDVSAIPFFPCFSVKLISAFKKTPVIYTWHEVWRGHWFEYLGAAGVIGKLIEAAAAKLGGTAVAVSSMTRTGLVGLGRAAELVPIVPNGVDVKEIEAVPPAEDVCDILFAGRMIRDKNLDLLLEAVAFVRKSKPDIRCVIIGDGPEKDRIERLSAELGLGNNVRFFGFLDSREVIARIKSSKVLVLPSRREGFGMIVLEAFAGGIPVITVDSPQNAAPELVDERCGLVVKAQAEAVGKAVLSLLADDAARLRMGGSAVAKARLYDWDGIVEKWLTICRQVIETKHAPL
ncbi:MAG: glycosyltransferase family 4 protein [Candidatus Aminicenantes bacterium]|nr:glycosyltransferase family 4 protein [Candidatus Aminicenantes bacterium]